MSEQDNMAIWNAVAETDPNFTKPGKLFGKNITSPNPTYQVRKATEQFGPIGAGWGYDVVYSQLVIAPDQVLQFADVTVWHGSKANSYGPIRGCNEFFIKDKRGITFDDNAPKKALTDALTKALSYLGFSADIFLGCYDDVKYVNEMKEKHAEPEKPTPEVSAWNKTVAAFGYDKTNEAWEQNFSGQNLTLENVRALYGALQAATKIEGEPADG